MVIGIGAAVFAAIQGSNWWDRHSRLTEACQQHGGYLTGEIFDANRVCFYTDERGESRTLRSIR